MPRRTSRDPPKARASRLPMELQLDEDRLLASAAAAEFIGMTASALESRRRLKQPPFPASCRQQSSVQAGRVACLRSRREGRAGGGGLNS